MAQTGSVDNVDQLVVSSGTYYCGELRLTNAGKVGIVTNMRPVESGQVASIQYKGTVKITASVGHTEGDVVYVNISTQATSTTAGSGKTAAGTCVKTVTSGGTLELDLNEFPYTAPA